MRRAIVAGLGVLFVCGPAWAEVGERNFPSLFMADINPLHQIRCFTPSDPLYPSQWHLDNSLGYPDVNVVPAWLQRITGSCVTIGIVDDGLETTHPDLAPNYVAADSWDFGQNDAVPNPVHADDQHGISVAGVAAARGCNALGVTGAAPQAGLAGLRVDFPNQTDQMFVDATLHHSSGANTSIKIKNHSYGIAVPFIDNSDQVAALETSAAAGTIHCFAAGNERAYHGSYFIDANDNDSFDPDVDYAIDADASKKHTQGVQATIAIAALGADGAFSYYSNWGANVFVTAPSSDQAADPRITTTDRTGAAGYNDGTDPIGDPDYTSQFGGTSSASPLVAGVLALAKEVNPAMDERIAKHLLVNTCAIVDPSDTTSTSDGGWTTNAAGNTFNQNYGFGLIDADALTQEAARWTDVTPLTTEGTGIMPVLEDILGPGGNTQVFSFANPGGLPLEEMEVHLDIAHTWRGDLEAYLTSPSGTTSRLMMNNMIDSWDVIDWTFITNAFWGEDPAGEWALEIIDTYPTLDDGFWDSYSVLAKTGHLVPEPVSLSLMGVGLIALLARKRASLVCRR